LGRGRRKTSAISCAKVLKGVRDGASLRWKEIGTPSGVSWGRWRRRRCFLLRERLEGERTTCGSVKVGILHDRQLWLYQSNLLFAAPSKIALCPCSPTSASQAALGAALRSPGEGVSSTAEAARLSLLVAAHLLHLLHPLLLLLSPIHRIPLLSPATSGIKGGGRRCPEVL
jgi:hypothetical protein